MAIIEVISEIAEIETIATGSAIRDIARLRKRYGAGRWLKKKGIATARLPDGVTALAEVHWYEAHGIGRREIRVKHVLDKD